LFPYSISHSNKVSHCLCHLSCKLPTLFHGMVARALNYYNISLEAPATTEVANLPPELH